MHFSQLIPVVKSCKISWNNKNAFPTKKLDVIVRVRINLPYSSDIHHHRCIRHLCSNLSCADQPLDCNNIRSNDHSTANSTTFHFKIESKLAQFLLYLERFTYLTLFTSIVTIDCSCVKWPLVV